jgi:transcription elongation factor GreB
MSRAFTKERDDVPQPEITAVRARSPRVTPAGFAAWREELARTTDPQERRQLEQRLADAVVVEPPEDRGRVAFGATVVVRGDSSEPQTYTIVGDDETDIRSGKISSGSPLAQALLGATVKETVVWHRPVGDRNLTVEKISY